VVVPTRNRRELLAATLRSVFAPEGVRLQLVVVDEGSTDDTPDFLHELARSDRRVTLVRHDEPRGVAAARNAGVGIADTPWIAFCDDDDLWAPTKLRRQLDALDALEGARWSCTGALMVDPELCVVGHHRPPASGDVVEQMRTVNVVPGGGSGLVAATDLVRAVGGFDAWFTGCEDYELGMKLALQSPLAAVDEPLLAYRVWPGTMSSSVDYMRTGHRRVIERWRGDLPAPLARRGDLLADAYFGRFHLRARRRWQGLRHYASMAIRFRQPRHLISAASALIAPGLLLERHTQRDLDAADPTWSARGAWLERFRA
jgi:glycosyltransferase involved in cell wall biosynthesis